MHDLNLVGSLSERVFLSPTVVTGWETENKYRVRNTLGQDVYFARESMGTSKVVIVFLVCSFTLTQSPSVHPLPPSPTLSPPSPPPPLPLFPPSLRPQCEVGPSLKSAYTSLMLN